MGSRSRSRSPVGVDLGDRNDKVTPDTQKSLNVKVFTLSGECLLHLPAALPSTTIRALKDHVSEASGVSAEEQQIASASGLLHGQQVLEDLLERDGEATGSAQARDVQCIHLTAIRVRKQRAFSGGDDSCIRLWDLDSGKELCTLQGHTAAVIGLEVDWISHRVLSGSEDRTLRLWDVKEAVSHDGSACVYAMPSTELGSHDAAVCGVAVDWDSDCALTWSLDCTLRVWNLEAKTCAHVLNGHRASVCDVDVEWEGMRAMSWGHDHVLLLWDLRSGALLFEFGGHLEAIGGVQVGWDQGQAISWSSGVLLLWDLRRPSSARELRGHEGDVACVSLDAAWRRALSAGRDGLLCLWRLGADGAGGSLAPLRGHEAAVSGLEVDWGAERALSWADDGALRVWDLRACRALYALTGHADVVCSAEVDWGGRRLLSWSDDRTLRLWELPEEVAALATGASSCSGVSTICQELHCSRQLRGHTGPIWSAEVSWGSRRALSWSLVDSTVRLWDLDSGEAHDLSGPSVAWGGSVEVSWSRKRALGWSCSGPVLWVWDLERGLLIHELQGHDGVVRCAALQH